MPTEMTSTESNTPAGTGAIEPMLPSPFRVMALRRENHDTFTLELARAEGAAPFRFAPGQFNMLYAYGVGEIPISISGDPAVEDRVTHTIRAVGAVSSALRGLRSGDVVGLRGPFGAAWPVDHADGRDIVIVAGGIGLAPLRPVVCHVLRQRARYGRAVLCYGARTPRDLLYAAELRKWGRRRDFEVLVTVDRGTAEWRGNVGVVTTLIPRARFAPEEAVAMVCGPEVMMRFTVMALRGRGVPRERIHVSMERNMKCAIGLCGHCQYGPEFICKDGPVFPFTRIERLFAIREL